MPGGSPPTGRAAAPIDVRVRALARCPLSAAGVARLATAVLRAERVRRAALSAPFVGRRRIRTMNRTYLGRDRETDVIAFRLSEGTGSRAHRRTVFGDVYVCPPVAAVQARRFATTVRNEARRLVVHGVLHLLGYDHPEGEGRTQGSMWQRQERYLRRFARLAR